MTETHGLNDNDTIVAVATAPGRGGIGIVRLSGSNSLRIGQQLCRQTLHPRQAIYTDFVDNNTAIIDRGIALYFTNPHSFTGEDVVELQAHGGPVVLDLLIKACCDLGARLAQAGEFSQRAYLNDKMDLIQAEAIADLINSTTEQAARNAANSLQGEFSQRINDLAQQMTQLRVYIEAAIDFPDEDGVDFIADGQVEKRLDELEAKLHSIFHAAQQGVLISEGMKLVILGKPNAGKSSLLNALSGRDTAIVTHVPGTTRDVLRADIELNGLPVHLVDTAGLRESDDIVEREGIRRAEQEVINADHILWVVDSAKTTSLSQALADIGEATQQAINNGTALTIVRNKCDLTETHPHIAKEDDMTVVHLCAKSGEGVDHLRQHLLQRMGIAPTNEGLFSARRRHLQALQAAATCLKTGHDQLAAHGASELLAEDLRQAHQHLGEITGVMSSDALLGHIFSSFCIGK